jgi:putative transposase
VAYVRELPKCRCGLRRSRYSTGATHHRGSSAGHQALREGTAVFRRQGNRVTLAPPSVLCRRCMYTSPMTRAVQVSPGGVHDLGYHVVWCPKYRRAVLAGPVAGRCRELISEKCAEHGWLIVALEVMPDHVHLFVKARPKDSPSYVANQLKGFTSRRLREEFPHLRSRLPTLWSRSFFVASVGAVSAATVQRYIDTQYERPWRKERDR